MGCAVMVYVSSHRKLNFTLQGPQARLLGIVYERSVLPDMASNRASHSRQQMMIPSRRGPQAPARAISHTHLDRVVLLAGALIDDDLSRDEDLIDRVMVSLTAA